MKIFITIYLLGVCLVGAIIHIAASVVKKNREDFPLEVTIFADMCTPREVFKLAFCYSWGFLVKIAIELSKNNK